MTRCDRENDLLDALGRAFADPELAEHVAGCASCSELRLVATALLDDRADAVTAAPVPAAGSVLWRIRMRQVQDAQASARRSLLVGQAATLAIAAVLIASFFWSDLSIGVHEAIVAVRTSTRLLLVVGAALLAAPIAGWVAIRQK